MRNGGLYLLSGIVLVCLLRQCSNTVVQTKTQIDTIIIRDTIRDTIPVPQRIYVNRIDTVFLRSVSDTVYEEVLVPIERKEYRTDDYFAVIEGYRPRLLQMEVFPETRYVTTTTTRTVREKPRLGIGIQAGYGYAGNKPTPYIGVGLQYNLITF